MAPGCWLDHVINCGFLRDAPQKLAAVIDNKSRLLSVLTGHKPCKIVQSSSFSLWFVKNRSLKAEL